MAEPDRAVRFISKLVELTQKRVIKWRVEDAPEKGSPAAFSSKIDGRSVRIYRFSNEVPNPRYAAFADRLGGITGSFFAPSVEPPKTLMRSMTILDVLDDEGRAAYSFKNIAGLSDLLETASYSAAKVDELMESVLSKP